MSEIRKYFSSRYASGYLVELDFSQLEIIALAYLSQDKQLILDLKSGSDLHNISATMLYGGAFTLSQRKIAKRLSFQLQYGSGPKAMADSNGIPLEEAKRFIKKYYERYVGVKMWQDSTMSLVRAKRKLSEDRTPKGNPMGVSTVKSVTGRLYTFYEQDSPSWTGVATSFSPTQVKNYPVQGFATGDIVPLILGKLYRRSRNFGGVKIVNTVHDSVLFDCIDLGAAESWAVLAKTIMEQAPRYLKEQFDINFDLPLKVEAEIGKNWMVMNKLDIPF